MTFMHRCGTCPEQGESKDVGELPPGWGETWVVNRSVQLCPACLPGLADRDRLLKDVLDVLRARLAPLAVNDRVILLVDGYRGMFKGRVGVVVHRAGRSYSVRVPGEIAPGEKEEYVGPYMRDQLRLLGVDSFSDDIDVEVCLRLGESARIVTDGDGLDLMPAYDRSANRTRVDVKAIIHGGPESVEAAMAARSERGDLLGPEHGPDCKDCGGPTEVGTTLVWHCLSCGKDHAHADEAVASHAVPPEPVRLCKTCGRYCVTTGGAWHCMNCGQTGSAAD
jgi:hypothetical protein